MSDILEQQLLAAPDAQPDNLIAELEAAPSLPTVEQKPTVDVARALRAGGVRLLRGAARLVDTLRGPSSSSLVELVDKNFPIKPEDVDTFTERAISGFVQELPLLPVAAHGRLGLFALGAAGNLLRNFQESKKLSFTDAALEGVMAVATGELLKVGANAIKKTLAKEVKPQLDQLKVDLEDVSPKLPNALNTARRLDQLKSFARRRAQELRDQDKIKLLFKNKKFKTLADKIDNAIQEEEKTRIAERFLELPKLKVGQKLERADVADIIEKQLKRINLLEKQNFITKKQAEALRVQQMDEIFGAFGIKEFAPETPFARALNYTTLSNEIQRRTGIRTGDTATELTILRNQFDSEVQQIRRQAVDWSNRLKKANINEDEATFLLQYFDDKGFNPSALKIKNGSRIIADIDELTPDNPLFQKAQNPEVQQVMMEMRRFFNDAAERFGVPKIPRYVPLRTKPQLLKSKKPLGLSTVETNQLDNHRLLGRLNPDIHETNIVNLINTYFRQGAKFEKFNKGFNDVITRTNMLKLLGREKEANTFLASSLRAMGIRDSVEAAQAISDRFWAANRELFDELIKKTPEPVTTAEKIYRSLMETAYLNLVSINPITLILQAFQPETLGIVELGPKYLLKGRKQLLFNKEARKEAERILNWTLVDDAAVIDQDLSEVGSSIIEKGLRKLNAPAKWLAKKGFEKIEKQNRLTTILGAWQKWDDAIAKNQLNDLLSTLSTAERQMILKALSKGENQLAKDLYATMVTRRVNFIYNVADKPEILSVGIGRYMPFTTFTRNAFARIAEDLAEGKSVDAAIRVLWPVMLQGISGLHFAPFSGIQTPTPGGPVSEIAFDVLGGRVKQAARKSLQTFTPLGVVRQAAKIGKVIREANK